LTHLHAFEYTSYNIPTERKKMRIEDYFDSTVKQSRGFWSKLLRREVLVRKLFFINFEVTDRPRIETVLVNPEDFKYLGEGENFASGDICYSWDEKPLLQEVMSHFKKREENSKRLHDAFQTKYKLLQKDCPVLYYIGESEVSYPEPLIQRGHVIHEDTKRILLGNNTHIFKDNDRMLYDYSIPGLQEKMRALLQEKLAHLTSCLESLDKED
jgi:glycosyltransferase involved in cell wall biosynthesis